MKTIIDFLDKHALDQPDRIAFRHFTDDNKPAEEITFQMLQQKARKLAGVIQSKDMQGERALLMYQNSVDYIISFFACLYAGVIAIPGYPPKINKKDDRMDAILDNSQARLLLTTEKNFESISKHNPGFIDKVDYVNCQAIHLNEEVDNYTPLGITADDLAFLQYTSGSTGSPKGVMVTHGNIVANLSTLDELLQHGDESVVVSWLPFFHDLGLIYCVLMPVYRRLTCVFLTPFSFIQKPLRWFQAISKYRGTHIAAPTFGYELCLKKVNTDVFEAIDLSSIEAAFIGAEKVRASVIEAFSQKFSDIGFPEKAFCPSYGLAEGTLWVTSTKKDQKYATLFLSRMALERREKVILPSGETEDAMALVGCGIPDENTQLVITDPESRLRLPDGRIGEIWVSNKSIAQGYWQNAEATEQQFRGFLSDSNEGPFLRTGDLGFVHKGQLYFSGRLKEVIIIRGLNYYPEDIENLARGSHDGLTGGYGAAFAIEKDGAEALCVVHEVSRHYHDEESLNEITQAISIELQKKLDIAVHSILLVKSGGVPKTTSGKIQRLLCKQKYQNDELNPLKIWINQGRVLPEVAQSQFHFQEEAEQQRLTQWLVKSISAFLNDQSNRIDEHTPFIDMGFDSVTAVQFSEWLSKALNRKLLPTLLYDHPNVIQLSSYLVGSNRKQAIEGSNSTDASEPIAIVGTALNFPGAKDLQEFWALLEKGESAVTSFPEDRVSNTTFYSNAKHGGFISNAFDFDSSFFGISPKEAIQMDPQQRIFLEVSWKALEHAGVSPDAIKGKSVSVYVGASNAEFARLVLGGNENGHSGTGSALSIIPNRLSYLLDLRGASLAIDTACSSSLVAIQKACEDLRNGSSEMAIAGGVNLILDDQLHGVFEEAGMLSGKGSCSAFDKKADGYVRSEGCGVVILKRLSDAELAGDNIMAVIKGSAVNQDGRTNGLSAPNIYSQIHVIDQALEKSGVDISEVGMIEAHGSGTPLGDAIELNAINAVMERKTPDSGVCWVSSVKTNIGHLESAAGIAGMLKVVLSLQKKRIPANVHFRKLNEKITLNESIRIPAALNHWDTSGEKPRIAGISSFGFGGTNVHMILEEYVSESLSSATTGGPQVLTISAKNREALVKLKSEWLSKIAGMDHQYFVNACYTSNIGRNHFAHRFAIASETASEAHQLLYETDFNESRQAKNGGIAFLFTGQGSQYAGMGKTLYESNSVFKASIDRCELVVTKECDRSLKSILFTENDEWINHPLYTQVAIFSFEYALAKVFESVGVRPSVLLGHSLGEYVAACIARVFSLEDAIMLVVNRARLMEALPVRGKMVSIQASQTEVTDELQSLGLQVDIAAINSATNVVLSGKAGDIEKTAAHFQAIGIKAVALNVSNAFHSYLMKPMLKDFRQVLEQVSFSMPSVKFISNVHGQLADKDLLSPDYWIAHIEKTVLFKQGVDQLNESGCNAVLEVGPKPVLLNLLEDDLDIDVFRVAALKKGLTEPNSYAMALSDLYNAGEGVDWVAYHSPITKSKVTIPGHPFKAQELRPDLSPSTRSNTHLFNGEIIESAFTGKRILNAVLSVDKAFSYLKDHVVYRQIVFPATGYLDAIYSLIYRISDNRNQKFVDFDFKAPIVLDEPQEVQVTLDPGEDDSYEVMVFSRPVNSGVSGDWQQHLTGKVLLLSVNDLAPESSLDELRNRLESQPVAVSKFYQSIAETGIQYFDGFQGVTELSSGTNEALGYIRLPEAAETTNYQHQLHPALFDAALQTIFSTLQQFPEEAFLPFYLEEMTIHEPFGSEIWSHASVVEVDHQSGIKHANYTLFNDKGKAVGSIKNLTVKRAVEHEFLSNLRKHQLHYEIDWFQQDLLSVKTEDVFTSLRNHVIEEQNRQANEQFPAGLFDDLNALSTDYLIAALKALGWNEIPEGEYSFPEILKVLEVTNNTYEHYLKGAIPSMEERGVLVASQDGQWIKKNIETVQALENSIPGPLEEQLVRIIGDELPAILKEDKDPLQLLFDSDTVSVNTFYHESSISSVVNSHMVSALELVLKGFSPHQTINLLEIGAGTGATTRQVLPLLKEYDCQYTFTDISQAFLLGAQTAFEGYENLSFRILDIDSEPIAQGFSADEFHIVLASNVLHATKDLNKTIQHITKVMSSGSYLIMAEGIVKDPWIDFVFGLTPGWWAFEDRNLRTAHPYIDVNQWETVLRANGFEDCYAAIPSSEGKRLTNQAIIIGEYKKQQDARSRPKETWVVFGEVKEEVLEALGRHREVVQVAVAEDLSLGKDSFGINVRNRQHYERLFNYLQTDLDRDIEGILVTFDFGVREDSRSQVFDEVLFEDFYEPKFVLLQVLANADIQSAFWLLSDGLYDRTGELIESEVFYTPILSFINNANIEILNLRCRNLDIGAGTDTSSIVNELLTADDEQIISLQGYKRLVPRLVPAQANDSKHITLSSEGTYLITGGLGYLGKHTATLFAEKGAGKLILVGRRGIASQEDEDFVASLENRGTKVSVVNADLSDYSSVEAIFKDLGRSEDTLKGIVHAAGVPDDHDLLSLSATKFSHACKAKVNGAWNLHRLTQSLEIEFFILYSSASSVWGSKNQFAYATANRFLDDLAHLRSRQGKPALSVNFGLMSGGMVAGQDKSWFKKIGLNEILQTAFDKSFELYLNTDQHQVITADVNWSLFKDIYNYKNSSFFNEVGQKTPEWSQLEVTSRKLQPIPVKHRAFDREEVLPELVSLISRVFGWNKADVDVSQTLVELGMDSLLAIELKNKIRQVFGVTLPISSILQNTTLETLLLEITDHDDFLTQQQEQELEVTVPAYEYLSADVDSTIPMTDIQKAYWIGRADHMELNQVSAHIYLEILHENVDLERLNQALNQVIDRHEMLRAVFPNGNEQKVLRNVPEYAIKVVDTATHYEQHSSDLLDTRAELSHQVFDITQWPLFDFRVTRFQDQKSIIHISLDLLISDIWSLLVIIKDLSAFYDQPSVVADPSDYTFRRYITEYYNKRKGAAEYELSRKYWTDRISTLPGAPGLPINVVSKAQPTFKRYTHTLSATRWSELKKTGKTFGMTPTVVLLNAFSHVLATWSKSSSFGINLTLFNREDIHPDIAKIVGDFTSTSILEIGLEKASFLKNGEKIQRQLYDDLEHRFFSGIELQREISRASRSTGQMSYPVVFTSALGLSGQNGVDSMLSGLGTLAYGISQTPQVWLDHQMIEDEGKLIYNWDIVEGLFPDGMIEKMFEAYTNLLINLSKGESIWLDELKLTPSHQVAQIVATNAPEDGRSDKTLYDLFGDSVVINGTQTAIIHKDQEITYAELHTRVNQLAHVLRDFGVGKGKLVGVTLEKGWEQALAVLSIVKLGAAYVPIDASLPYERQQYLLQVCNIETVVVNGTYAHPSLTADLNVVTIEELDFNDLLASDFESCASSEDIAYIIFTSGSTGKPKGVTLNHEGPVNTIQHLNEKYSLGTQDKVLAISDLNFDLSVYDIFGTLAAGGTIIMPEAKLKGDPMHWINLVIKHKVTLWNSVPALARLFVENCFYQQIRQLPDLRLIWMSGDWIPLELPDKIKSLNNHAKVISMGGATEASIWSIHYEINEIDPGWKSIPYGKPLANQSMFVLKDTFEHAPTWVPGMIYIGGVGLATSYWGDPEKTQNSFIQHPETGERLYRTGDLGRYLPDGNIEFLGREDFQVKVNGYRIELGEIERQLLENKSVGEAIVVVDGDRFESKRLVAFIKPAGSAKSSSIKNGKSKPDISIDEIEALNLKLKSKSRAFEGTQKFVELPKTNNGPKLDYLLHRKTHREFGEGEVSFGDLSELLSCLRPHTTPDNPLPKYLYPSAGSLYPVQTYISIKPGAVTGVEEGFYYYDAEANRLIKLSEYNQSENGMHHERNVELYRQSSFSLFLVADSNLIEPVYHENYKELCLLEAGYMGQLLMNVSPSSGLGLCPIGTVELRGLFENFQLSSNHTFLHGFVGGLSSNEGGLGSVKTIDVVSEKNKLKKSLGESLPDYMIPAEFIFIDEVPLSANGKVDRKALIAGYQSTEKETSANIVAQTSSVEKEKEAHVIEVVKEVLGVEHVNPLDDLFELGVDSVMATLIISRLRSDFNTDIPVNVIFEHPNIRSVVLMLEEQEESLDVEEEEVPEKITRMNRDSLI